MFPKARVLHVSLLILLSFLLSACLSRHEIRPNLKYTPKPNKGIVVLSLTTSGLRDVPFLLRYRKIDDKYAKYSNDIPFVAKKDWLQEDIKGPTPKGSFEGRLIVMELPESDYEFYNLVIQDGYMGVYWSGGVSPSWPFQIKAGQINYVGNLHIWSESNDDGLRYQYNVSDQRDRDIKKLYESFPLFEQTPLVYTLLNNAQANDTDKDQINDLPEEYRHILSLKPSDGEAYKNRARVFLALEKYQPVIDHTIQAIALDDSLIDAYLYRSIAYLFLDQVDSAIDDIDHVIQQKPTYAKAYIVKSALELKQRNKKNAQKNIEKAESLSPKLMEQLAKEPEMKAILQYIASKK